MTSSTATRTPLSPVACVAQASISIIAGISVVGMFSCQQARVSGTSMAPTLQNSDQLLVNTMVYRLAEPRRGDIVALRYPIKPAEVMVKRVIAQASDTVRITAGHVYVNDRPIDDDYVAPAYRGDDDWGPKQIPKGYYFVMGDHRNRSWDSRHWGLVPRHDILGKIQVRLWPLRLF